jgi:PAS domain S-box-containing protein
LTRNLVAGLIHGKSDAEICASIRGNLEAFPQLAHLSLLEIGTSERAGTGLCSVAGAPLIPRTPLTPDELHILFGLSRPGEVAAGSVRFGPTSGRPVIPVFGLVREGVDGKRRFVAASLDLEWLNRRVNQLPVPDQAALLVLDRTGNIAARKPVSSKWPIGQPAPRFERTLPQRGDFAGEVVGQDATRRYYTVRRIDSTDGLIVLMKRRSAVIFAASHRHLVTNLVSILIIFAVMLTLAWLNARKHVGWPLRKLGQAADRIAARELTVRTGMDYRGEIGKLAQSFDSMASAVQQEEERNLSLISSLRESERRFRAFLESVHLAVFMSDTSGTITFCNDYFLRLTGWTRDEMVGRCVVDFVASEDRQNTSADLETLLAQGTVPQNVENTIVAKDGKRRLMQWNNTTLRDAAGALTGFCGLGVDVTEHRALMEQRQQSDRLETVGRLAAGVAHDFNNLLTVINGYSDLALRRLRDDHPLHQPISQIRDAGEQAATLTRQLLAFSRRQVLDPRPLALNEVIAESGGMFDQLLRGRVRVITSLAPALGQFLGDKAQLQQVLINLITNSMHATPDGGTIRIETSTVTGPEGMPGSWVLLSISDTGTGMDKETLAHIFEPFFTQRRDGKGTGLGLSIVYGIVQQSKGHLTVESNPGSGTTFRICWPRVDSKPLDVRDEGAVGDEGDVRDAGVSVRQSAASSETILIVEDRDDVRGLVVAILQKRGYGIMAASCADDALRMAAEASGTIDLLLTDIVMPEMNGHELAKLLRMRDPALKVLFMSGYAANVIKGEMLTESGFDFIQKPMTGQALADKVRHILDAKALSVTDGLF